MLYVSMFDLLAVIGAAALGIALAGAILWFTKRYQIVSRDDLVIKEKQPGDNWQNF